MVLRGVPLVHVDAVEDAIEVHVAARAHVVEPETALRRLHLLLVRRRHRHDTVRHLNAALEQLDLRRPRGGSEVDVEGIGFRGLGFMLMLRALAFVDVESIGFRNLS